jgi:hypothetical protein
MGIVKSLKIKYFPSYFKWVFIPLTQKRHKKVVRSIRQKGKARIAFIVSNLSMWRCRNLYELLLADPRFEPSIILFPFKGYNKSQQDRCMEDLRSSFESDGIPFIDLSCEESPANYFQNVVAPDIVFYPQPYYDLLDKGMASENLENLLLCYVPYGLNIYHVQWLFNQRFSNIAWRLYLSSPSDLDSAEEYAYNKGRNVRIVGNPKADEFMNKEPLSSVWKPQDKPKKKVIWAPHYSFVDNGLMDQGTFLHVCEDMIELAKRYSDSVQFAFKPHPLLATALYSHPDWGKGKTDKYYETWASMSNTQLETEGYVDLFLSSDAMIHDCGSFTAEYHYTGNPVLFITSNKKSLLNKLSPLGKDAFNAHYFGEGIGDIERFLKEVVLSGNDTMSETRNSFYLNHLLPPNGKSAAQNIYEDLVKSLWPSK